MDDQTRDWLAKRPTWLRICADRILAKGKLESADLDNLADICCGATADPEIPAGGPIPASMLPSASPNVLRLVSIGDVEGIDELRPRTPLPFGNGLLTVIYGNNGSGKSGYVRILKKACGKATARVLRSSAFAEPPAKRSCRISFELNGTVYERDWDADGSAVPELLGVDIFDSDAGRLYV